MTVTADPSGTPADTPSITPARMATGTAPDRRAGMTTIHPAELRQLRIDDPHTRILDVRSTSEFESVHIPGSFNVPLEQLAEHVDRVAGLDRPVVLVCLSGNRASTAQAKLDAAGKTNIRVLEGGIGAWQASDGDVVRGDEKWAMDRQVRGVAGALIVGSILASIPFPKARFLAGGVGFGLWFSAVSNTCAMGALLGKLPYNRGPQCVIDDVLADMS